MPGVGQGERGPQALGMGSQGGGRAASGSETSLLPAGVAGADPSLRRPRGSRSGACRAVPGVAAGFAAALPILLKKAEGMVFFFQSNLLELRGGLCYTVTCLPVEGKGPPGAPEPPYPQGVAAGARPEGPSPGVRACRGAGGAWCGAPMGGQGGLETGLFCGSVQRGHTRGSNIQYIHSARCRGGDPRALAPRPGRSGEGCRGRARAVSLGRERGVRRGASGGGWWHGTQALRAVPAAACLSGPGEEAPSEVAGCGRLPPVPPRAGLRASG